MNNDIYTFVISPMIYSGLVYWILSGFYLLLDINLAPKYRIEGGEKINWKLYKKTIKHVLFLHSITPIVLYFYIPLWKYRNIDLQRENFLTLNTFIRFAFCPILSDIIFYSFHYICHLNFLYKHVHKKHHEWIVPCAVAASYTTIYEYIFCNLQTFLLPPLILNMNWYGANLWFIYSTIHVINDHSGYVFLKSSIHHTNHHKFQKFNYGSNNLDKLLDTDL